MAKIKTKYICGNCGYETVKWLGKCPDCGMFNSFSEEIVSNEKTRVVNSLSSSVKPVKIGEITYSHTDRTSTDIKELDTVLNGGIVKGSLTLVGGDPGIGKSTLLLQLCENLCRKGKKILYISGEESPQQIKLRASRLNVTSDNLLILSETNGALIEAAVNNTMPDLVVIDSIQTMYIDELSSAPGSVTQVREVTGKFMRIAKGSGISVIIVGHVTKEGAIAGPRMLEHMVDTVLYFEGDRLMSYRILRAVKNRFGGTNEIGVFEMTSQGLKEIANPSEYMLSGRPLGEAGSVITCCMEGTRPMLIEVQALVSYTSFGMPRRMSTGVDFNRTTLLIAVLEKKADLQMGNYDSYVNITGGIKIAEPALDAALATAIASSYTNRPVAEDTIIFGEIGLTGELRGVAMAEKRVAEAKKLGFKKCILPAANIKEVKNIKNIQILTANSINELLNLAF